jgi:hypothetical protein
MKNDTQKEKQKTTSILEKRHASTERDCIFSQKRVIYLTFENPQGWYENSDRSYRGKEKPA